MRSPEAMRRMDAKAIADINRRLYDEIGTEFDRSDVRHNKRVIWTTLCIRGGVQ